MQYLIIASLITAIGFFLNQLATPNNVGKQSSFNNGYSINITPTKETTRVTPTTNPDPIITCNIHTNCGGGSKQLKKSVCDNMTCCNFDPKCGGSQFVAKAQCNNSYCCFLKDGTAKLLSSKNACDNYYTNVDTGSGTNNPILVLSVIPAMEPLTLIKLIKIPVILCNRGQRVRVLLQMLLKKCKIFRIQITLILKQLLSTELST
ncbi:hypothetical protein COT44_01160 [Candidatus Shapirobacteria bacterium CG08_land_8_20_14_0_20_39_18]|uniref:Uncharacterized protein n=1 Tax=Candidatus Shapirobacteria bacterium CG08_land_8_20_14_0_20_39_18 TaxID=1974883 RepID=A0A2M6XDY0_9BACT|nr:MAG: hypothetical protein COT44_01160 [Candidatus Shapirobacteria bacterium CG08_land_8_20_14_0_20_39_18]PJE68043.1 MAG: hypothetical protein COU94_04020 [Candidatus Shapirobacteria bacterium CG10_big_fil_rev_8_21_14_0_10_38_8]